jgi:hypothetical protein
MIADGLPETTDHDRKPTKSTQAKAKSGRANKLNYPIERKKTSRKGHRNALNKRSKGLFHADLRPISGFIAWANQVSNRPVRRLKDRHAR